MHVYNRKCGVERFVAESLDDAKAVAEAYWLANDFMTKEDILADLPADDLVQAEPGEIIGIYCNAEGEPCDPSDDGAKVIRRTAADWAASQGRGFLSTTEF